MGLRAIALAADRLAAGEGTVAVAGGTESMSNTPHLLDAMVRDGLWDVNADAHMGELTELMVEREGIDRETVDEYAARSHRLAAERIADGVFDAETVAVVTDEGLVERDDGPRPESTVESLGELPAAFADEGTITAGNASKLADGAGVVLLATAEQARERGLDPMAHLVDYAVAYRDPREFNEAVVDAVWELLGRTDLAVSDVGHFEVNEAFAAQSVLLRERLGVPTERLNPDGGAVAFGHPIGASGGDARHVAAVRDGAA